MMAAVLMLLVVPANAANLFGPKELDTTFGGEIRLREEIQENNLELNTKGEKDRDYFRLRTLVYGKLDYAKKVDFFVRLGNEMKFFNELWASYRATGDHFYVPDELYVDNLYMTFYNLFGLPVDIRVGRQDIMLGDGFLVAEGTPGDGSRSLFFDALRGTVKFTKNHSLDLIGVSNGNRDKRGVLMWDHIIDKTLLNVCDEQAIIIYGHSQIMDSLLVEPYYIYKREEAFGTSATQSTLDLNTFGARAVFTQGFITVKGELAYQTGGYDSGISRRGLGGHAEVVAKLDKVKLKPQIEVGVVNLSGDDRSTTGKNEGWDPLFSRYPVWSDVYVYTLRYETAGAYGSQYGYWTNLQIYRANAKLNFDAATYCQIGYAFLRANELSNVTGTYASMFSGNSKDRGHLLQGKVYHSFTKALDAYISADYFFPGDYYTQADNALFLRWQINLKF